MTLLALMVSQGHMLTLALANLVGVGVSFECWMHIQILVKLVAATLSHFLIPVVYFPFKSHPLAFVRGIKCTQIYLQTAVSGRFHHQTGYNRRVRLSLQAIMRHPLLFPLVHANPFNHFHDSATHVDKSHPMHNLQAAGSETINSVLSHAATPAESFCCTSHASSPTQSHPSSHLPSLSLQIKQLDCRSSMLTAPGAVLPPRAPLITLCLSCVNCQLTVYNFKVNILM